jgi:hypothetical protein
MTTETPAELSDKDMRFIENHVIEISRLPEEKFNELTKMVIEIMGKSRKLAEFIHPDNGNSSDSFDYLFERPSSILIQLVRQAREIRESGNK